MNQQTAILLSCCLISSGLTWAGTKSMYAQLQASYLARQEQEMVSSIIVMKKLETCAVSFGTYIATKGKYGHEYFEKHR